MALWKWLLLPWMAAVIVASYLWAKDIPYFQSPKTARIIFWHVPMAMLSMVWFLAAAIYSGRYLIKRNPLDDIRSELAAEMGLLLTVLATVTGAVFSKMQWNGGMNSPWYEGYWQWDPKQTAIVIVLFIFMAYFAIRMSVTDPARRANLSAVYAILGFAAVPFLYYVLPHLPAFGGSQHPELIVFRGGMDVMYKTTFRASTLGFLGITTWGYQLKLRLAQVAERIGADEGVAENVRYQAVRKPAAEQQ